MLNPLNWPRLPAVLTAVQRSVRTDISPLDMVAIGAALLRDPGDPDRLVLDTTYVTPFQGADGAFLLEPKPDLKRAVARFVGVNTAAVEVLNGAGVAGIARTTADKLAARGIAVARVGDADRPQAQTTVLTRPPTHAAADAIARTLGLPGGRVSESSSLPADVDVRVVVGSDLAR